MSNRFLNHTVDQQQQRAVVPQTTGRSVSVTISDIQTMVYRMPVHPVGAIMLLSLQMVDTVVVESLALLFASRVMGRVDRKGPRARRVQKAIQDQALAESPTTRCQKAPSSLLLEPLIL